jgi:hypothetical protein
MSVFGLREREGRPATSRHGVVPEAAAGGTAAGGLAVWGWELAAAAQRLKKSQAAAGRLEERRSAVRVSR